MAMLTSLFEDFHFAETVSVLSPLPGVAMYSVTVKIKSVISYSLKSLKGMCIVNSFAGDALIIPGKNKMENYEFLYNKIIDNLGELVKMDFLLSIENSRFSEKENLEYKKGILCQINDNLEEQLDLLYNLNSQVNKDYLKHSQIEIGEVCSIIREIYHLFNNENVLCSGSSVGALSQSEWEKRQILYGEIKNKLFISVKAISGAFMTEVYASPFNFIF